MKQQQNDVSLRVKSLEIALGLSEREIEDFAVFEEWTALQG